MDKINKDSFNRIVAYGCSYTAGDELVDHVILGISFDECNKLKNLSNKADTTDFYKKLPKDILSKIEIANRQASWAGQLAMLLNKPFLNRAKGGSGIDEILFNIVSDRTSKIISDTDLIIVGLTYPERIIHVTDNHICTLHLSYLQGWPSVDTHKAGVELWNNSNILFNYYKTLLILTKLRLNIKLQPICIPAMKDINKNLHDQVIMPLHNEISDYMFFTTETLNMDYPKKHAFGHVAVGAHIELADKIHKQYF
jgi:hypothetical protein